MARQGALAALILVLAACGPHRSSDKGGAGPDKKQSGELDVTVEVEAAGASPREGELATVIFKIHNGTANVLVLRDLSLPRDLMMVGSSGAVMTWQFPAGTRHYVPDRDE
jgi:hypothetical protein